MKRLKEEYIKKCKELRIEPLSSITNKETDSNDEELNLAELTIGSQGTIALAYALEHNDTFTRIDLRFFQCFTH